MKVKEAMHKGVAEDSVRHEFLAALEDNPPAAILLTTLSGRSRTVSMPPMVGRSSRRSG